MGRALVEAARPGHPRSCKAIEECCRTMPKSRGRRNTRQPTLPPTKPLPPAPKPSLWRRLSPARRRTRVLVGTLAGLVTIATGALTFWSQAALQVEAVSQSYSAFSLPFSIANPSSILAAKDVATLCRVIKLRIPELTITNSAFTKPSNNVSLIGPNRKALVNCPVLNGAVTMDATIAIEGTYHTLGISRSLQRRVFRWLPDSAPPRWVEDDG